MTEIIECRLVGTFIHPRAIIEDNVHIGDGTRVWHDAQLRNGCWVGKNCNIGKGVYIDANVVVWNHVKIQNYACLYQGLEVEDDVFIGPHVCFTNDKYPRSRVWDVNRIGETLVQKGASIGANSTIVCGVCIGQNSMVGAGSVVTRDVPDNALVYGCPAIVVGSVDKYGSVRRNTNCIEKKI